MLLETRLFTLSEVASDDAPGTGGSTGCWGVDAVSAPGVDDCEEASPAGSAAGSTLPLPSIMLGQPDADGATFSRSLRALMASSLRNQQQQTRLVTEFIQMTEGNLPPSHTHTTPVLRHFFQNYPGEPVPEEN